MFSAVDFSAGSGRPEGGPGLFAVNYDGTDPIALIQRKTYLVVDAGMSRRTLDWNHRLLTVPRPKEGQANNRILVGKLTESAGGGPPNVLPIWLNVDNGSIQRTDFQGPKGAIAWMFDSQGEPRVVITRQEATRSAHWRGPGEAEWRKIVDGDLVSFPFTPHTVDDIGNLYVTRLTGKEGYKVLTRFDFERMAPSIEPLVVTRGFDFSGSLVHDRAGEGVQGVRIITDAETTVWFDQGMKKVQMDVDARFPGRVNRVSCRHCGQSNAVILVRSFSDQDPGRVWIYKPGALAGQPMWLDVATVRGDVDPRMMASMDFYRIKARDGGDLPIWVTRPRGLTAGKPAPAVVLVHGGPWVRGASWEWAAMPQFLASRGYLVIEPEFRGSAGYGEEHFKAGWKQWGQAMQSDVADALLWAQKQNMASDKACIAGASYGGYSALMGLARQPELYRCGLAWVAVTDLPLLVSGSWWVDDDTSDLSRRYTLPEMVGDASKDADMLAKNSPVMLAESIKAPVLLAFGEADRRVPLAHGKRMREALQKNGLEPEWVTYAGEGHGWAKVSNRVDFAQRVEIFLAKHLLADGR